MPLSLLTAAELLDRSAAPRQAQPSIRSRALPISGASPAPALSSEASPTPAGVFPPHDPLADIETEFAGLIAQPWLVLADHEGTAFQICNNSSLASQEAPESTTSPTTLLPRPAPRPSISTAMMRRRAISKPAILAAPLPNLRDALTRRAAVFGPYDLDEPPVPPPGILARCAAGMRSVADFLEPRAGR